MFRIIFVAITGCLFTAHFTVAAETIHHHSDSGYRESYDNRLARSGYALSVAPWAKWTYGPKYKGYYVGGGAPECPIPTRIRKEPPYLLEGTWGVDYAPRWSSVSLLWTHGALYQGGTGQYEPDRRNFPFGLRYGRSQRRSD